VRVECTLVAKHFDWLQGYKNISRLASVVGCLFVHSFLLPGLTLALFSVVMESADSVVAHYKLSARCCCYYSRLYSQGGWGYEHDNDPASRHTGLVGISKQPAWWLKTLMCQKRSQQSNQRKLSNRTLPTFLQRG